MGETINIINNIKVNNIIFNGNNICYSEKLLIDRLNKNKINYYFVKEGDKLEVDKYKFHILNPYKDSNDENKSSIVIYTKLNNQGVLFTGDADIDIENYIIKKYNLIVDVLKVGHHGSKTSTSEKFIMNILPKYSVISVGLNNKFGHPNIDVIKTLNKYKVKTYFTSKDGSIKFVFRGNDVTIFTTGT